MRYTLKPEDAGLDPDFLHAVASIQTLTRHRKRLYGPFLGLADLALEHAANRETEAAHPKKGD